MCAGNWCRREMTPQWPVFKLLKQAIGEKLKLLVGLAEIGGRGAEKSTRMRGGISRGTRPAPPASAPGRP